MNVEIGRQNIIILFWNEAMQFHMNWKQTFIMDSYQPFISSAEEKMLRSKCLPSLSGYRQMYICVLVRYIYKNHPTAQI